MLASLIYFLLLLVTVLCLDCERCSSSNTSCTGAPYSCPKTEKHCLTVTTEYFVDMVGEDMREGLFGSFSQVVEVSSPGGSTSPLPAIFPPAGNERWISTYKGCTKKHYCFASSTTFTFPSQRKRRAAKCCHKDLCNRGTVKLPRLPTKPNGLLCPGCFSTHSNCKPTETLKCHGHESKCVYYDMTVEQGNQIYTFAKRGCGTKYACMNKPNIGGIPGLFVEVWKTAKCTPAPRRLT